MRKISALLLVFSVAIAVASQAVSAQPPPGKGKKVVASATGSGHLTQNTAFRTFAFSAREHSDGTDRGQAQLRERGTAPVKVHVRITCLNVVGDIAYMTGFVSKVKTATPPLLVTNSKVSFSVEDNGPTGDRVSAMTFHGNVAALDCETTLAPPTLVVQRGQIKVRP
jgi:hypothetical protein